MNKVISPKKVIIVTILLIMGWYIYNNYFTNSTGSVEYKTQKATKGKISVTVNASGTISSVNSAKVTTKATGVIKYLYVKDGEYIKQGAKIADIDLDQSGKQNELLALASYRSAKNALETARAAVYSTQSEMFTNWDKFYNLATSSTYQNSDGSPNANNRTLPEFHIANDNWLAAEARYKTQLNAVTQAQTAASSSWISYQQASSVIYAPISGIVTGLSLQKGSVIGAAAESNTTTTIAQVVTEANPAVTINITEIDIPKISMGDKATIRVDAFPDKSFTGQVTSINKVGTVSSGVTTYPVVVNIDTAASYLLPNMAADTTIITETKNNVLKIPSSAIKTEDGVTTVTVLKNGNPETIEIETGISSDTETEIVSGISSGEEIVTNTVQSGQTSGSQSTQQSSPFSPFGNTRIRSGGIR